MASRRKFLSSITCDEDAIRGWALSLDTPLRPIVIEIRFDSMVFCRLRCVDLLNARELDLSSLTEVDEPRRQAFTAALDGWNIIIGGFSYMLPAYLPRDRLLHIVVCEEESREVLFDATTRLDGRALRAMNALHDAHPRITFKPTALSAGSLHFNGLYGGVANARDLEPRLSVTGLTLEYTRKSIEARPGWYVHRPDLAWRSFSGQVDLRTWDGSAFEIRLYDRETDEPQGCHQHALFVPADAAREYSTWAIPGRALMTRVMGHGDAEGYYLGGYATFRSIEQALQTAMDASIDDFPSVLDWGSGCGRLSQHIARRTGCALHGIDIDPENVEWTRRHIPRGTFVVTPLLPPAPLPSAAFDLIVGVSVFTHLNEDTQWQWLRELHRLLRPGGVLVVSIRSVFALFLEPHPVQAWWRMMRHGIDDTVAGSLLDAVTPLKSTAYYRETYHSHEYILNRWSRWFDVLGIYVGASFDYQDICVLRRREHVGCLPSTLEIRSLRQHGSIA